jgi:hypothetical protein
MEALIMETKKTLGNILLSLVERWVNLTTAAFAAPVSKDEDTEAVRYRMTLMLLHL